MKKYTIKRFTKIGQQITYYYDFPNDKFISEKLVIDEFQYEFEYSSTLIRKFFNELKNRFRPGHNDLRLYTSSL